MNTSSLHVIDAGMLRFMKTISSFVARAWPPQATRRTVQATASLLIGSLPLWSAKAAHAETSAHAVSLAATADQADMTADRLGAGAALAYRWRSNKGQQFGLEGGLSSSRESRIGGFAAPDARVMDARLVALLPALQTGSLSLGLRLSGGIRHITSDANALLSKQATVATGEVAGVAGIHLGRAFVLRAGVAIQYGQELAPTAELEALGFSLCAGVDALVSKSVVLFAALETGPSFGYDGDGTKYRSSAAFGIRYMPSASESPWALY